MEVDQDDSVGKEVGAPPASAANNAPVEDIAVIDLADSDDESLLLKRKKVATKCINYDCQSGVELRECPSFCHSFYQVKKKEDKLQEVCAECYEEAIKHFQQLSGALAHGQYLIERPCPVRNDLVEIVDSDEEGDGTREEKDDLDYYSQESLDFISEHLVDIMNETLSKYNLLGQVDYSCSYMNTRTNELQFSFNEIDEMINGAQKTLDNIRTDLYAQYKQPIKELSPLEIMDTFGPTATLLSPARAPPPPPPPLPPPPPKVGERRSHRNVSKPASYAEPADNVDAMEDVAGDDVTGTSSSAPGSAGTDTGGSAAAGDDVEVVSVEWREIPARGPLVRPRPLPGDPLYAMKQSAFSAWARVRVLEVVTHAAAAAAAANDGVASAAAAVPPGMCAYRVRYEGRKGNAVRTLLGKHLAYTEPSRVQLEVGTRVIAVFVEDANPRADNYFTGVVAEPLCAANSFRYLVFFDDGYAQYVPHHKTLAVCESSRHVWEDIHPDSRLFIRKYLEQWPERPMVRLQPGHVVKTEWNGKWWVARVLKVDGSLAQMYFDADARSEWIYRGSTRLGPLFMEVQAATSRQEQRGAHHARVPPAKRNLPYVEYTRVRPDDTVAVVAEVAEPAPTPVVTPDPVAAPAPRAVARKSTTARQLPSTAASAATPCVAPVPTASTMVPFLPTQQVQQPQSKVVYFTPKTVVAPKTYVAHECSPECRRHVVLPLASLRGYNPLSKPLLCGWYRIICKYRGKKYVRYRAPCARSVRSPAELHRYLRATQSDMSVDMFDFDAWVHCLAEFVLDKTFRSKKDISDGVEAVPIPCVNYVDSSMPDFCNYSTRREPMEGVRLNLDPEFLCACDCEDDCADKERCQCWQLTIREFRTVNKRTPVDLIGYTHKRLPEFVTTGIYECNQRCRCAATCLNRVVQHPLQLKLQLFKTANRGWGIRCLNDIPQGAFICIYAGSLLTDKMANEGGVNYGDEYLAELDYIEVVERQKDGYESDVDDPDAEAGEPAPTAGDEDEDDGGADIDDRQGRAYEQDREFVCSVSTVATCSPIRTRLRKRTIEEQQQDAAEPARRPESEDYDTVTISDDEDTLREPSRFDPSSDTTMAEPAPRFKSVRKMFGEDEVCYIMDAKNTGNIGRYLNHSCNPNVFVQNVFVDTHDLRFPWVAFFAMNYIRAGTELTWNYNYDVGSVPGKVIFCHCGSSECRGRLL